MQAIFTINNGICPAVQGVNQENLNLFDDLQELFDSVGLKLNTELGGKIALNHTGEWAGLSDEEITLLDGAADKITLKYSEMSGAVSENIAKAENNIRKTLSGLSQHLNAWVTTDSDYTAITDAYGPETGTAIQEAIGSIQWQNIDTISNWGDAKKWVSNNILDSLTKVENGEIRQAYLDLFTNLNLEIDSAVS